MVMRSMLIVFLGVCAMRAAAADEIDVFYDGRSVEGWDTGRDRARLEREFAHSSITVDDDAPALRWQFLSKGVAFNDIFYRREVSRPFRTLRLRVRNAGAPIRLAVKARDAGGAEWTANTHGLAAGGDWQTVTFPMAEWHVASWSRDADGHMDFPLDYVTVIAFDVGHRQPCDVRIGDLVFVRPEPPTVTLTDLEVPRRLEAGKTYALTFSATFDRPCELERCEVAFLRGQTTVFSRPLAMPTSPTEVQPGATVAVAAAELSIPLYAWGGELMLALRFGEARVSYRGERVDDGVCRVHVQAREPGTVAARVAPHRGVPTLRIADDWHAGMAYTAYHPSVAVFEDFTAAGVDLYSFSATPTEAGYELSRTTWTAPDVYDYSQLDERVMMVLEANPRAHIFPRLYLHAPPWWSERHPDDLVRFDPGNGQPEVFIHSGGKPAPSWVSEAWRRATIEGLRRLIAHVDAAPYADRVIGYHLASGTTEEWMMWGANENQWVGYSPVTVAAFRRWLTRRYGSDAALRQAWHRDDVSLGTATVPARVRRADSLFGILRDPDREQDVVDFYLFNSDMVADTIRTFAGAVKEMTGGRKTVGVFYGYTLQLCGQQRQQNAGHLALGQVLACEDVDFLCSPTSYAFRQLGGEGTSHFMSLLGSVRMHGKLWFNENDIRTSLAPGNVGGWGKAPDIDGDILQQDKELANVLVNGAAQWWFDVGSNRYDDPRLMAVLADWVERASTAAAVDRTPVEEVALVVDERSLTYLRTGHRLGSWLLLAQLPELHRVGAPVGHYLSSDLDGLGDKRFLILACSFAPSEAERRALDRLKGDGRVLLFLGYPGLYRNGRMEPQAMQSFTGIRLGLQKEAMALQATFTEQPFLAGVSGTFGPADPVQPVAVPEDPDAVVLARFDDGTPAMVLKEQDGWTAVFSAVPLLPAGVLARLAAHAGVHRYIETPDVVWACRDMVALSVREGGPRVVRLPAPARVVDLLDGSTVLAKGTAFEVNLAPRATRTFVLKREEP